MFGKAVESGTIYKILKNREKISNSYLVIGLDREIMRGSSRGISSDVITRLKEKLRPKTAFDI